MTRRLGRSDVVVDRWSLGTAALGGLYTSVADDDADALVARAFERGVTYFDTAPQYGHGTAERRLGHALAGVDRHSYTLATKVGRLVDPDADGSTPWFADAPPSTMVFAFDRDSVLRSLTESMDRLGLDRIDVVSIHDPDDHADQAIDEAYPVLHDLRAQGVIRAIGVGMNQSAVPTRFVHETEIDFVLLAGRYTLLDQSALSDLVPAARRAHVALVIGGVFNSGILADADPASRPPTFDYRPAPAAVLERVDSLRRVCAAHDVDLARAALAFPFREPAVASVLLGARSAAELDANLEADADAIPAALWDDLAEQGLIHELDDTLDSGATS